MMPPKQITINARKYDQSIRRSWQGGLISSIENLLVVVGRFESEVEHSGLGTIKKNTVSVEYFWLDRWYNIFRFLESDGSLRNYYCNVAMPATIVGGTLDYVDLDIDVVVWPNRKYEVLDRDEFKRNTAKYGYPEDLRDRAEASVSELMGMIERSEFPFDVR
ncbi:MAG: DUF402 domain-containing protein [Acidobacteriota bacterium]